jgi:hypothetical protein
MRWLIVLLIACGPSTPATTTTTTPPPPQDTRTPIEKRRDAGCEQVGKMSAHCAVEDSNKRFAKGEISKTEHEQALEPKIVRALTDKYTSECRSKPLSSRQVRVMEVCMREETECGPWESCIANMQPQAKP